MIKNKPDAHKMLMLLPPPPPQLQAATVACKAAISVWTFWKMKINCSLCSKELVLKYYSVLTYKIPYVSKELPFKSGAIKSSEHPSLCSSKAMHIEWWAERRIAVMHLLKTLLHKHKNFKCHLTQKWQVDLSVSKEIRLAWHHQSAVRYDISIIFKIISSFSHQFKSKWPSSSR